MITEAASPWQRVRALPTTVQVVGFLGVHAALGLAMSRSQTLASLHALGTLALALAWVSTTGRFERVPVAVAYLIGADVLWRMSGANAFWEFGKLGVVAICVVAKVRTRAPSRTRLPLVYLAMLLPSIAVTASALAGDGTLRRVLSSSLSGPVTLAIAAWFFSTVSLTKTDLRRTLAAALGPICGVAAIAGYSTLTSERLQFQGESIFETSGGFGPNQVSAVLGLGSLLCFFFIVLIERQPALKAGLFVVMLGLMAQSALTFSRGGLYVAGGAFVLASLAFLRTTGARTDVVAVVALLFVVGSAVLVPRLETFTGGKLIDRFTEADTTGRDALLKSDLDIFLSSPVFGVGPGQTKRSRTGDVRASTHNEFTRLLAEHGTFGIIAVLLVILMARTALRDASTRLAQGVVIGSVAWAFGFMAANGMRIVAPGLMFGLAFLHLLDDGPPATTDTGAAAAQVP